MLREYFGKIGDLRAVQLLRKFFSSPWFLALIVALMAAANLFSLELPVYYLYIMLGALVMLFDDDMRNAIPICLCAYMTVSYENNPALFPVSDAAGAPPHSAFYDTAFRVQLIVLISLGVGFMIARLITILARKGREKRPVPALVLGFAALGLSFVLGGAFTEGYGLRTVVFGLAVIASMCALYFLFYYGVDWRNTEKGFWAEIFLAIGLALLFELVGMYVKSESLQNGIEDRGVLITGWGMYNNVGCILGMCAPAGLYLAAKREHGWAYALLSLLLLVGILFTQSRSSILFGGLLFAAGGIIVLVKTKGRERRNILIVVAAFFAVAAVAAILAFSIPAVRTKVLALFEGLFKMGADNNGRWEIYRNGWEDFLSSPAFGVGFYRCRAFRWGKLDADAFLPPRYHNTLLQTLATGGIVCFVCYLMHRVETVFLLFRHPTAEKTFIALGILALLLTSLVECHLFSFGPAMFYSVLLAAAEGSDVPQTEDMQNENAPDVQDAQDGAPAP